MSYKYYFNTYQELLTFIAFGKDLWTWGCMSFILSSSTGSTLNLDTSNNSGAGIDYITFSNTIPYISNYYNDNKMPITMDVKLKCRESFRAQADPSNYYQAFFLNIFTNGSINYLALGYNENGPEAVEAPFTVYVAYIQDMFDKWKTYYATEYES